MNEQRLRTALRSVPVDADGDARRRARRVVLAASAEAAPPRRRRTRSPRIVLAVAACLVALAGVGAATRAPTDALARWLRDAIGVGEHDARPVLGRVPGGGRLLVTAGGSAWVVSLDGSKRRLGRYDGASWSPHGLYVAAWRGGELTALEPGGEVHWSLRRPQAVRDARWEPVDGYRIAYLAGGALRIVNGDGSDDHRYAPARTVAPEWSPGGGHVLAWVDPRGRVRVDAVDARRSIWRTPPLDVRALVWSPQGDRLLIVAAHRLLLLRRGAIEQVERNLPPGLSAGAAAWSSDGIALVRERPATGRSDVVLLDPATLRARRLLFAGAGKLGPVRWSAGGRLLLVPWPAADQWLFLTPHGPKPVRAVADVARQFAPGADRPRFPSAVDWAP